MADTGANEPDILIDPNEVDDLKDLDKYLTGENISIEDFVDEWHAELEEVLIEGLVDHTIIQNICKFRILPSSCRPEVWRICLNVTSRGNALASWDGSLDLPEQEMIHDACQALEVDDDKKAHIESVITFYCKSRALKYQKSYGWTDLLRPLLSLTNFDKADMYNCFYALLALYVPKQPTAAAHLFRLLLLYHDPELCSFLDSHKVTMEMFSELWFKTLYASHCKLEVAQGLWDVYLQRADPLFVFFLALVILVNAREQVLGTMTGKSKNEIADELCDFPSALEAVDIEDFCQLAAYFGDKTPQSLHDEYQIFLFSDPLLSSSKESASAASELAQSLCLQISVHDMLHSADPQTDSGAESDVPLVRYFLVDCRSPEKYNAGHFFTAFHIDPTLMLREPKEFATAVDTLQKAQQQAIEAGSSAGGEHICFIGSGTEEEDQYMYMVVAHLLKKHQSYVSILRGGFAAVLSYLKKERIDVAKWITAAIDTTPPTSNTSGGTNQYKNHQLPPESEHQEQKTVGSFMKNLSTTLKSKSSSIRDKVTKLIEMADYEDGGHVDASSRSKPYRGTQPVFSIGDEDEHSSPAPKPPPSKARAEPPPMEDSDVDDNDLVNLENWLSKLCIKDPIACFLVAPGGRRFNAHLAIDGDDLVCLREYKSKSKSKIVSRLPLSTVTKITSKRSCPELITFRFSRTTDKDDEGGQLEEAYRYLIPDAGQATKRIKQEIMRVLDATIPAVSRESEQKST